VWLRKPSTTTTNSSSAATAKKNGAFGEGGGVDNGKGNGEEGDNDKDDEEDANEDGDNDHDNDDGLSWSRTAAQRLVDERACQFLCVCLEQTHFAELNGPRLERSGCIQALALVAARWRAKPTRLAAPKDVPAPAAVSALAPPTSAKLFSSCSLAGENKKKKKPLPDHRKKKYNNQWGGGGDLDGSLAHHYAVNALVRLAMIGRRKYQPAVAAAAVGERVPSTSSSSSSFTAFSPSFTASVKTTNDGSSSGVVGKGGVSGGHGCGEALAHRLGASRRLAKQRHSSDFSQESAMTSIEDVLRLAYPPSSTSAE
jgi:hypothetical protein